MLIRSGRTVLYPALIHLVIFIKVAANSLLSWLRVPLFCFSPKLVVELVNRQLKCDFLIIYFYFDVSF